MTNKGMIFLALLLVVFAANYVVTAGGNMDCKRCKKWAPPPWKDRCQSYGCGGKYGTHSYTCCNHAKTTCDGVEYDYGSDGDHCGPAGQNKGGGCAKGKPFTCGGCKGTTACKTYCDKYFIHFPGVCWDWQDCFETCCADPDGPKDGVKGWVPVKVCQHKPPPKPQPKPRPGRRLSELHNDKKKKCAPCNKGMGPARSKCPRCGDGKCDYGECCSNCPEDCGPCGGAGGDPHIKKWNGDRYSFHGECDLVLLHSQDFANGLGLDIHIRTKIQEYYSFIETAVVRIGKSTLAITAGQFWIDGTPKSDEDLPSQLLSGYTMHPPTHHTAGPQAYKIYKVDLNDEDHVSFRVYNRFVFVDMFASSAADFEHSTGLLGDFDTGASLGRDGRTVLEDANAMGFEWQVRNGVDPSLFFHDTNKLPAETCKLPTSVTISRHLRSDSDNGELLAAAQKACAQTNEKDFDFCVFDVVATGDLGMAEMWL